MKRKKKKGSKGEPEQSQASTTELAVPDEPVSEDDASRENEAEPSFEPETDDPLKTIYQADDDGEKVDMTKLERKRISRSALVGVILGAGVVIAAAAYSGFLLFNPDQTPVNQEEAELSIDIPDNILSGDEIELVVNAKNNSRVDWNKTEITMRFPDGWVFVSSEPTAENSFNNAWNLEGVNAGGSKTLRLRGQLLGEVNATKSLEATLIYTPGNFQSEFKEVITKELVIADSILSIALDGASKVVNDQEMTATLTIENRSKAGLEQVAIRVDVPNNFELASTDPAFTDEEQPNEWRFDRLEPGQKEKFYLHGKISGEKGDRFTLKGQIGLIEGTDRFKIQQAAELTTEIISPELDIELKLNGSSEDQLITVGDTLRYSMRLFNASDLIYNDVRLSLNLDALSSDGALRLLDWDRKSGIDDDQIEGSLVHWSKEDAKELAQLDPKEKVEVAFSVPLVSKFPDAAANATRLRIESTATISGFEAEGFEEVDVSIQSKTISGKITSTLNVLPEARYYTEELEQLGIGPLPPVVGETTTYRIFFYLSNTLNELSDVVVSATLPSSVTFAESIETNDGELTFDEKNHTVIWRMAKLPAHTGTANPTVTASFLASITPTSKDVGEPMMLVSKVVGAGRDAFTDQKLTDDGGAVDTELENDVNAVGRGSVVKNETPS